MAPQAKTAALLVRMGEDEVMMLADLAEHSGLSRADVIRQLIRREHKTVLPVKAERAKPARAKAQKKTKKR